MLITENKLNVEEYEQNIGIRSQLGSFRVPKKMFVEVPETLMNIYLAGIEEFTTEDGTNTVTISNGLVKSKSSINVKVYIEEEDIYIDQEDITVDFENNEVEFEYDQADDTAIVEHYPQQGSLELYAEAPSSTGSIRGFEFYGNEFEVLFSLDQTREGAGVIPNTPEDANSLDLPEEFRIVLYVDSPVEIDFESSLTGIEIQYNQTSMKAFEQELYGRYPELEGQSLRKLVLDSWE